MGTNYYAKYLECDRCNRYEEIHIGKSSSGWQFSFFANDDIRSYKEWIEFLEENDAQILDEYGKEMKLKDFKELVKEKQIDICDNHAEIYGGKDDASYLDDEGYSMSPHKFS